MIIMIFLLSVPIIILAFWIKAFFWACRKMNEKGEKIEAKDIILAKYISDRLHDK